jgi:hypothetical protein
VTIKRGAQAVLADATACTNPLREQFSLHTVFLALGAVG